MEIEKTRIKHLNPHPFRPGKFILYWMQQSQRVYCNHALEFAVRLGNQNECGVAVLFVITPAFLESGPRHYRFMLEGLKETARQAGARNIPMYTVIGSPPEEVIVQGRHASCIVTDRGYLKLQREWRNRIAREADCQVIQIEPDVVVPVETLGEKELYSAYELRRRIKKFLPFYLEPLEEHQSYFKAPALDLRTVDIDDIDAVMKRLGFDGSASDTVGGLRGGYTAARKCLDTFIADKLELYAEHRNHPDKEMSSGLSPYLHFGQISPIETALAVVKSGSRGTDAFLEQLIVRRELAVNFVFYNTSYDSYEGITGWAKQTLSDHAADKREYNYSRQDLEKACTHDDYWNAAQNELVLKGTMNSYMRMYWAKKMIEWCGNPAQAYDNAVYLNNTYAYDGRDPNSYAGIAWCFGKHDRPWKERDVFGKVRYMNAAGLRRKFKMNAYLDRIGFLKNL